MRYLLSLGIPETVIVLLISLGISIVILMYGYVLIRLISKAWHKSKNEERST